MTPLRRVPPPVLPPSKPKRTAPAKKSAPPATKSTPAAAAPRLRGKATVHSSEVAFAGNVFRVTTDRVTEPGGVTSTRDVIRHSGSVVVLAVAAGRRARNPSILIERQYRHAAGKFLLELPAGRIEPGERPLAAGKRELLEETGYRARRWSPLTRYYASPGFLAETMQVFLAEDIEPGPAQPEDDERIELDLIPLDRLLGMIDAGQIEDGKTVLSVLLFAARLGVRLPRAS